MEEGQEHNTQACEGLGQKNQKSLCCNLATQPALSSPSHIQRKRREAAHSDNEAASLPVFILSWINSPERNAHFFFVRKRTCAASFGAVWYWDVLLCFFFSFFFAISVPSRRKTPTDVGIWLFPTYCSHVGVCSFGSHGKWSTVGVQILPGFRKHSEIYLHIQSTDRNSTASCRKAGDTLCLSSYLRIFLPHLAENMKRSVPLIPGTHSLFYCFSSCVTLVSSANQFCHGECI